MDRRDFLAASAGALAVGVVAPAALWGGEGISSTAAHSRRTPIDFREIRRGVGVFTSRGGTIGWLVNSDGVVVVDSQYPDTAATCLAGLQDRSGLSVDTLINTHHHGDHTGGNQVFRDAVRRIVAHERARDLQASTTAAAGGTAPEGALPDTTYTDRWSMNVGDETVHLRHYGPAHTGGDSVVTFERANVVHMGDLVFNRLHPFIDRPGGASISGWITLLERTLADHDAETVYILGHGHPEHGVLGSAEAVSQQRDYLSALLDTAGSVRARGGSRGELEAMEVLPEFEGYLAPAARLTLGFALGVAWDEITGTQ